MNNTKEESREVTITNRESEAIQTNEPEKVWDRFIRNTAIFLSSTES